MNVTVAWIQKVTELWVVTLFCFSGREQCNSFQREGGRGLQIFAEDVESLGYFILLFSIASEDTLFLQFFAYTCSLSLPQASLQCNTDSVFSIKYLGLTGPRLSLTAPCLCCQPLPAYCCFSLSLASVDLLVCVSDYWWWLFLSLLLWASSLPRIFTRIQLC